MPIPVIWGGEVCEQIAATIVARGLAQSPPIIMESINMSSYKRCVLASFAECSQTAVVLVQTIENNEPPEAAGGFIRFFKKKTHSAIMLADKLTYSVLAIGDSNLLLDRQTTAAKDCNAVGQALDARLQELGATCFYERGEVDERTGMEELEPWMESLWPALATLSKIE